MFCGNCGKKISDDAKFCPFCGSTVNAEDSQTWTPPQVPVPPQAVNYAPPVPPQGGKKSKGGAVLAAVGGVAVVAIAAAIVLFSGVFGGPKGTLVKAMAKSMNAYHAASEAAGMPDLAAISKGEKVSQELSLQVDSISEDLSYYSSDAAMLEGWGISMSEGMNLPGRKMDLSLGATYHSKDVLNVWAAADDAEITFGSPQLLGNSAYGFNTETLGKDLARFGDAPDEVTSVSFNIFDMIESMDQTVEVDKAAAKEFADAIEVEKDGSETVAVNGYDVNCAVYHVLVPQDAVRTYLSAVQDAYEEQASANELLELLVMLGVYSDGDVEDLVSENAVFELLDEIIQVLGDIELDIYVSGGYVMAAEWNDTIEGTALGVSAYFGGGKNYADDWSLEITVDSGRVTIASTGNHSAEGGAYTDETSVTVRDGSDAIKITSELTWDAKKSSDNFSWSVKSSGIAAEASGQLDTTKNSMELTLDKLSVNAMGTDLVTLSGGYVMKPYEAEKHAEKAVMLASLTLDDLEDIHEDVVLNVQDWVLDLMNDIPELAYMF